MWGQDRDGSVLYYSEAAYWLAFLYIVSRVFAAEPPSVQEDVGLLGVLCRYASV